MDDVTLENTIKKTIEYCLYLREKFPNEGQLDRFNTIEFSWHGGEPLLAGINFYKKALFIQEKWAENLFMADCGLRIVNKVQTNGSLITREFAKFFKENNFSVGVSIDGYKEINDKTRIYPNSNGTFDKIMKGIGNLKKEGAIYGGLLVVSKNSIGKEKEIFNFFNSNKIDMQVSPLYKSGRANENAEVSITPGEYLFFMKKMLKLYVDEEKLNIRIKDLDCQIDSALYKIPSPYCRHSASCIKKKNTFGIDYDGTMYPCNRYVGMKEFIFGNINDSDVKTALWESSLAKRLEKRLEWAGNQEKCNHCSMAKDGICKKTAGCVYGAFSSSKTLYSYDPYCDVEDSIYQYSNEIVSKKVSE